MRVKAVILMIVFLTSFGFTNNNLPDILKNSGTEKDHPGSAYLVIFDKTDVEMKESGLTYVVSEVFIKVLNKNGSQKMLSKVFGYDPLSSYIDIKEAKIVRKDGKIEKIDLSSVRDYTAPARAIYWGAREKILPVGKLTVGDGIYVKTFRKGFTYALLNDRDEDRYTPPMKGHFYDIVPFYSRVPVKLKTYKIEIPNSKELQFEVYNGEVSSYKHFRKTKKVYFWKKANIKPYKRESNMVAPSDVFTKLLLSTSPDWEAKSKWFYKVNEDYGSFKYNKEIVDKVKDILSGANNDWDKIARLTHWVAEEIRYSGLSMGKGEGYTLHKGTTIFRDRCGVCKDKASMLITLLRAAGFESYAAMTMAGSRIDRIPADQFNHSVTVVKINGKYHLLDPTWVPGVRELWSSREQQQQYLMGLPEGADLRTTDISPPENHYLRYRINSVVHKDGSLSGRVSIKTEGQSDSRLRWYFKWESWKFSKESIKEAIYRQIRGMKISNLKFSNPFDLGHPMSLSFDFLINDYLVSGKKYYYLNTFSGNLPLEGLLFFKRVNTNLKKRKYPFKIGCSQEVTVHEKIKLPAGLQIYKKPSIKDIAGENVSYRGSIRKDGRTLSIVQKIKLNKRIFESKEWIDVKNSIKEFFKMKNPVILTGRR
jgi:transglutaminase-like putative cysteine protease